MLVGIVPWKALPLLRARFQRLAEQVRPERIKQLIADLDADTFATRQQAATELEQLGMLAEPALRVALARNPALEVRQRLEKLLLELERPEHSCQQLWAMRALELLERMSTAHARALLESLALQGSESWLGQQAGAGLTRLACLQP